MALIIALVARGVCDPAALLFQRHWRALEHGWHGATVEVSTFRVTGPQQAPGSCRVYGPLPPGYMAGCTIHTDSFGEVGGVPRDLGWLMGLGAHTQTGQCDMPSLPPLPPPDAFW
jgi:hypothetical protein